MSEASAGTDVATVPLSIGAQRLGLSWTSTWRLVLTGELEGEKVHGRWLLTESSLRRLCARLTAEREGRWRSG